MNYSHSVLGSGIDVVAVERVYSVLGSGIDVVAVERVYSVLGSNKDVLECTAVQDMNWYTTVHSTAQ